MKKVICLLLSIVLMLRLSSCALSRHFNIYTDEDLAEIRIEQIVNALKKQDKDTLKALFSKKALAEANNIDDSINDLLNFIQGNIVSWEDYDLGNGIGVISADEHVHYGDRTKKIVTWYGLTTDAQDYRLYVIDYAIDTIEPDNEGMYTLAIVRAEENETLRRTSRHWEYPGIAVYQMNQTPAIARREQLFNALKEKDKEAIKSLFSKKTIDEAESIDDSVDKLMDYIQGEDVLSLQPELSPKDVREDIHYEDETKKLTTWYELETDEEDYAVLVIDNAVDLIDPDNAGLYTLAIVDAEEKENLKSTIEQLDYPGVFIY